jgi:hypothetical protein
MDKSSRPPCAIPTAADNAVVWAKASDTAHFGRIDRGSRRPSRCRETCDLLPKALPSTAGWFGLAGQPFHGG